MFPKVQQSSRPESLGFPSYIPPPWTPPLQEPHNIMYTMCFFSNKNGRIDSWTFDPPTRDLTISDMGIFSGISVESKWFGSLAMNPDWATCIIDQPLGIYIYMVRMWVLQAIYINHYVTIY